MSLCDQISKVVVLGGGSAGLMAAVTVKRLLPQLDVKLIRSADIGVIGVGEGTTAVFPSHFFETLKVSKEEFYRETQPTWKQGIRFEWGPRDYFNYTFEFQYDAQRQGMSCANGFYADEDCRDLDLPSALMDRGKAFVSGPLGKPLVRGNYAFHIENHRLVTYLEKLAARTGVELSEGTLQSVEQGPNGDVSSITFEDNRRIEADLFIDASGFRAELIGRVLNETFLPFSSGLFCDRAVIGGWDRGEDPLVAYTTAETMDSGWCWKIEHEHWINRGYVYASQFISDDQALEEFLRKNPKVSNTPRVVKFRSGRYDRSWVKNVVAIGNSSGFVEPLEATALAQIIYGTRWLIELLRTTDLQPSDSSRHLYNTQMGRAWDEIRDFLAFHYKFNHRIESPFWSHCHHDTSLGAYQGLYDYYLDEGPGPLIIHEVPHKPNIYGVEGFLSMLVGMKVPYKRRREPTPAEQQAWKQHSAAIAAKANSAVDSVKALAAIRSPGWVWE
jgi:tryptophan 7-halogenase